MSAATVETAVQASTDQIGAIRGAFVSAMAARNANALWNLSYTADDVPYDNRVLNSLLTAVDTAVNSVTIGSGVFANWFNLHNAYFSNDAGLTFGASPLTTIKAAIEDYYRWRVGQYFNQVMTEATGSSLLAVAIKNVFPRPDLVLGSYAATGTATGTFTAGSTTDSTKSGPGTVGAYVTSTIGGNNLVLALTCKYEDATTVAVAVTVPTTSIVGAKVLAGKQAITSANAGTGVVGVGATGQFKVGQKVLLVEGSVSEVADVISIVTNTSITVGKSGTTTAGLRNSFTSSGFVYPQFIAVTAATNSNGTNADAVQFRFEPDRPQTIG